MEESFKTRIVTAASRCDVGRVRKINQDTVFCSLEPVGLLPNLFIVADGMGGHKAGDLASTETVRCFVKCIVVYKRGKVNKNFEYFLGKMGVFSRRVSTLPAVERRICALERKVEPVGCVEGEFCVIIKKN